VPTRGATAAGVAAGAAPPPLASLQDDFARIEAAEKKAQERIDNASFQQQVGPGQTTQLLQVLAEGQGSGTGTELGVGAGVGKTGALPTPPLASSPSHPAPMPATDLGGYWYADTPREWSTVQERSADGSGWEVRQQQQPARAGETPASQMPPAVFRPVNWRGADGAKWRADEGYLPPLAPAQPTQHIFKTLPAGTDCGEAWCSQGWGAGYNAAHNITEDPFEDGRFRAYTAMPTAGPIADPHERPVEQAVQARMSPLEINAQEYVMVPLSPLNPDGGGVARGSWVKIDDGFNVSAVLNDTATLSAQVYNDTLNLYNDTEVALTWPDWQEQWADMEEEAEGYGEEE